MDMQPAMDRQLGAASDVRMIARADVAERKIIIISHRRKLP